MQPTVLDLVEQQIQALQQLIMNIPDMANLKCKLFHAISKMLIKEGYIFRFHPSGSQQAQEVVAGLLGSKKGYGPKLSMQ